MRRSSKLSLAALATAILGCHYKAHAACGTISANTSSAINTAISTCTSGTTLNVPAGTYTINSQINVPCGVSISGPVVATFPFPGNFTVQWNGSAGASWPVHFAGPSCTAASTVQYISWNGGQPTNGGGGLFFVPNGSSNLTFQYMHLYGAQAGQPSASGVEASTQIWFDGNTNDGLTQTNMTVQHIYFGSTAHTDCSNVMKLTDYYGGNYSGPGGECAGVGIHEATTNLLIQYNKFEFLEQGIKFYESTGNGSTGAQHSPCQPAKEYCHNNANINYNDFGFIHRIGIEQQGTPSTTINFEYNSYHDTYYGNNGSFAFSIPGYYAAPGGPWPSNIFTNVDYNVMAENTPCVIPSGGSSCYIPAAFEFWSGGHANYNLVQGWNVNGIEYGPGKTPWVIDNNVMQNSPVVWEGCTANGGGCASNPTTQPQQFDAPPTMTGNTGCSTSTRAGYCTVTTTSITALPSNTPTVSPTGGAVSSGTVVSISAVGSNRDANTSAWCTTDGTTPVPGSGTATIMTSYTVTSSVTLKCVGMWGASNQPTTWPTNYGYVPSPTPVTNSYTVSGTPTVSTPIISPAGGTITGPTTITITDSTGGATIHYTTDGTTPTSGSPTYTGTFTVSSTTTVQAIGIESGYANSAVASQTYTLTVPTLSSCYQGNSGSVNTLVQGQVAQQHVYCVYPSGTSPQLCDGTADTYGSVVTQWAATTGNITVGAVGSGTTCNTATQGAGCVKGVTVGSPAGNTTAQVEQNSGSPINCSAWTWYVTSPGTSGFVPGIGPIVIQ